MFVKQIYRWRAKHKKTENSPKSPGTDVEISMLPRRNFDALKTNGDFSASKRKEESRKRLNNSKKAT